MKKLLSVLSLLIIATMILTACGAPATTAAPATAAPAATPSLTPYPIAECQSGKTCIRWFVGLGTGTDPVQIAAEEAVVKDFNASNDKIQLILEVVPYNSAKDTLSTEIAAGNAPDVI